MRRASAFLSLALLVAGCGTSGGSPTAGSTEPAGADTQSPESQSITLNLATDQPVGHMQMGASSQRLADEVAKRTNGRVQINVHFSESLTTMEEILDSMQAGVADVAAISLNRFPAVFPLWSDFGTTHDLDLTLQVDPSGQTAITRELMSRFPELEEELAAEGLVPLALLASGPHVLMSKEPITTLEDLSGLRIRTYGTGIPLTFESAGAIPVSIGGAEIYSATAAGTVDGAFSVADFFESNTYEEVAPYITIFGEQGSTPLVNIGLIMAVSQRSWDTLSEEDRQILLDVGRETEEWLAEATLVRHQEALDAMVERGAEIVQFDEASLEEWRSQMPDFFGDAADSLNERGYPGDEYVATIEELVPEMGSR